MDGSDTITRLCLVADTDSVSASDLGRVIHAFELIFGSELEIVGTKFTPRGGDLSVRSDIPDRWRR
jgi:hypothetical protein